MTFKNWLLNEDGFGDGGSSWDVLYPSYADDYARASAEPLEHYWLQWKWDRGTDPEIGRTLHNIDNSEFQKRKYVGISSNMPDAEGDGFWEHKPDNDSEGYIKPYETELVWIAQGKTANGAREAGKDERIWAGANGPTTLLNDTELDNIFHDEDRHSHKWPHIEEDYMDKDWIWPQHKASLMEGFKHWLEYGGGGGAATTAMHGGIHGPGDQTNAHWPVRSKINAPESPSPKTDKRIKNGQITTVDDEWLGRRKLKPPTKDMEPDSERRSMWIDKRQMGTSKQTPRANTVY